MYDGYLAVDSFKCDEKVKKDPRITKNIVSPRAFFCVFYALVFSYVSRISFSGSGVSSDTATFTINAIMKAGRSS